MAVGDAETVDWRARTATERRMEYDMICGLCFFELVMIYLFFFLLINRLKKVSDRSEVVCGLCCVCI